MPGSNATLYHTAHRAPDLSVVVPCFNEKDALPLLLERLSAVVADFSPEAVEIFLIDDGSRDDTWRVIVDASQRDNRIVAVRLTRNFGHQKALTAGLELCRGSRVLILDADLQDPPELLIEMMQIMDDGADVVYGRRRSREGEGWLKRRTADLYYRLLRTLANIDIPRDTGDFRLMNRRAVNMLNAMPEGERYLRGMIAWVGLDQRPIFYDRHTRSAGKTKYSVRRMIRLALEGITSFSIYPLRIASLLGILMSASAILVFAHAFFSWLYLDPVSGWTSMIIVVLTVGGVQLLILGVIGEYLGRIYLEVKRRPTYLVDRIVRSGEEFSWPAGLGGTEEFELNEHDTRL